MRLAALPRLGCIQGNLIESCLRWGLVGLQVVVGDRPNAIMKAKQRERKARGLTFMTPMDDIPLSEERKSSSAVKNHGLATLLRRSFLQVFTFYQANQMRTKMQERIERMP